MLLHTATCTHTHTFAHRHFHTHTHKPLCHHERGPQALSILTEGAVSPLDLCPLCIRHCFRRCCSLGWILIYFGFAGPCASWSIRWTCMCWIWHLHCAPICLTFTDIVHGFIEPFCRGGVSIWTYIFYFTWFAVCGLTTGVGSLASGYLTLSYNSNSYSGAVRDWLAPWAWWPSLDTDSSIWSAICPCYGLLPLVLLAIWRSEFFWSSVCKPVGSLPSRLLTAVAYGRFRWLWGLVILLLLHAITDCKTPDDGGVWLWAAGFGTMLLAIQDCAAFDNCGVKVPSGWRLARRER